VTTYNRHVDLLPCPFCGQQLARGSRRINRYARCTTEDCYGAKAPVVNLDVPGSVAAWNKRAALPQAQADGWLTDIENAPQDGSEVLFPIEFVARAYWDKDLKRWVMSFGLHMDYVNAPTRYRLPRAQSASLIAEQREKTGEEP